MTLKFENPGYVYILSNESLPNVLKIGYTQNSPYQRQSELYTTGLPTPFVVEKFFFVEDACVCEELIHIRLNRSRVNSDREFFKVEVDKATRVVEQAIDDMRERLWMGSQHTLKNKAKDESIIVPQYTYNNPKFKELMKILKENRKLLNTDEIAKELKISTNGVDKIIAMMNKQEGSMLYMREENRVKKYSMSLAFNEHQLKLLDEKFPDLSLIELAPLFKKPSYSNNSNNTKKVWTKKAVTTETVSPKQPQTTRTFLEKKIEEKDLKPKLVNPTISKEDKDKIKALSEVGLSKFDKIMRGDDQRKINKPN